MADNYLERFVILLKDIKGTPTSPVDVAKGQVGWCYELSGFGTVVVYFELFGFYTIRTEKLRLHEMRLDE